MQPIIHINHATLSFGYQGSASLPSLLCFADLKASKIPAIGKPWPEQSGIRGAYMPAQGDIPGYSIIVPDAALSEAEKLSWGRYGVQVEGLSDWDGKANTVILAASDHPAAKYCAAVKVGDHNDFYLMSAREASLLRAVSPHLFSKGLHWTSSQYSSFSAFCQDFDGGSQYYGCKDTEGRVRAVRRVIH